MKTIPVMVNGLPGNVSKVIARHILNDDRFNLLPWSLTGPEIEETICDIESTAIELIKPIDRDTAINDILEKEGLFISVDFTHPSAINDNAVFYCNNGLPFVMGTTGGNRAALEETVNNSRIPAVIAPNMAKQIVGFQAMMEWASHTLPDLFKGFSLKIRESHQNGKADTSGTAKAMVTYFNSLGISFSPEEIQMVRDPKIQVKEWEIPKEFLGGHGWHTYTLISDDKTVKFEFTHNISGREVYAYGTKDAIVYLQKKIEGGSKGEVFSMIDVLKGI